jgi:hypothetical protein
MHAAAPVAVTVAAVTSTHAVSTHAPHTARPRPSPTSATSLGTHVPGAMKWPLCTGD